MGVGSGDFSGPPTSYENPFSSTTALFFAVGLSGSSRSIKLPDLTNSLSLRALGGNLNAGLSKFFNSSRTLSLSPSSSMAPVVLVVASGGMSSGRGQWSRREGSHKAANLGPEGIVVVNNRCFFRMGNSLSAPISSSSKSSSLAENTPGLFLRGITSTPFILAVSEGGAGRASG